MPRRREIPKRELAADPIYSSVLVSKFITVMRAGSAARRSAFLKSFESSRRATATTDEGLQDGLDT